MRKYELSLLVFLIYDVNLYSITYLEVWSVTEFVARDDSIALVANVDHNFAIVDACYSTIDYFVVINVVECAFVSCSLCSSVSSCCAIVLECFPIEIFQRFNVLSFHKLIKVLFLINKVRHYVDNKSNRLSILPIYNNI